MKPLPYCFLFNSICNIFLTSLSIERYLFLHLAKLYHIPFKKIETYLAKSFVSSEFVFVHSLVVYCLTAVENWIRRNLHWAYTEVVKSVPKWLCMLQAASSYARGASNKTRNLLLHLWKFLALWKFAQPAESRKTPESFSAEVKIRLNRVCKQGGERKREDRRRAADKKRAVSTGALSFCSVITRRAHDGIWN